MTIIRNKDWQEGYENGYDDAMKKVEELIDEMKPKGYFPYFNDDDLKELKQKLRGGE